MKSRTKAIAAAVLAVILILAAVGIYSLGARPAARPEGTGQIYLYGEVHGIEVNIEKEFELWSSCYHHDGMRHLFLETPCFYAGYLNLWMQTGDEDTFSEFWQEYWEDGHGYPEAYIQAHMDFYRRIKEECPETVFHGTDLGWGYWSTGEHYLEYLESAGQTDTEQYRNARENIEQAKYYYDDPDDAYRENKMAENFIREMDSLGNEDVMAIHGGAHTDVDAMDYLTGTVPTLGGQLYARYGDKVHSVMMAELVEPIREEAVTIGGKEYTAQYYGKIFYSVSEEIQYGELWRLEGALDDFKSNALTFQNKYSDSCFFKVEEGDVLVEAYTYTDGSVQRHYYRAGGLTSPFGLLLEGFLAE